MATEFEINGKWTNSESGQKYTATAVKVKSRRVLAVVSVDVPVEVGVDFAHYFGSEQLKTEIEQAGREQARVIAEATPDK